VSQAQHGSTATELDLDEAVARLRTATLRLGAALRAPATLHGLTPSRLGGLVILAQQAPIRVGDFARELGITAPSASRLVDVLVESGTAERQDDPSDQRACMLALTAQGLRILDEVRRAGLQQLSEQVRSLPDEQCQQLLEAIPALQALADALTPSRARPEG
jgi:DNA-binding MarR family transcriptional regulator